VAPSSGFLSLVFPMVEVGALVVDVVVVD